MKHLPNILTIGRILVTPFSLWLLWQGTLSSLALGTFLFILAAITDWYDGYLARKYNINSRFGQFMDPLADKILVLGAFAIIPFLAPLDETLLGRPGVAALTWLAILLIAVRDFAVTGLRSYFEKRGQPLKTLPVAKMKTAVQLTFLITVMVFLTGAQLAPLAGWLGGLGRVLDVIVRSPFTLLFLLFTSGLTVYTGALYFLHREKSDLKA